MKKKLFCLIAFIFLISYLGAQTQSMALGDWILITIFLKHQEEKNLDSIQAIQKKNHFDELFTPASARIISWYVMMGVGQLVTVKIPASELRTLNTAIEKGALGAFNTEFYPTYDYMPVWKTSRR